MKKFIKLALILISLEIYSQVPDLNPIKLGTPGTRMVQLAIDGVRLSPNDAQFKKQTRDFYLTLVRNLKFSNYFKILKTKDLPSSRGGLRPSTINFYSYKKKGTEFLLKTKIEKYNGGIAARMFLYDVVEEKLLKSRLYPLVSKPRRPGRELGLAVANDVVFFLSGQKGFFNSQILMVCGKRIKEIYRISFDGAVVKQLTRDKNLALSPSWSRDGKRFLYTSFKKFNRAINPNLYVVDLEKKKKYLISGKKGLNTGGKFNPVDSNKIAYTYSRKGQPEIHLIDLVAKTRKKVTNSKFFSVEPSWSPNGSQLTFSSSLSGKPHIYTSFADGTNLKRLTHVGAYNSSPAWSPKENTIAFASQVAAKSNQFDLYTINTSGSNLKRLTMGKGSNENPSFSPDGKYITFASNRDGAYKIYIMTKNGSNVRRLSPKFLNQCTDPDWSPSK